MKLKRKKIFNRTSFTLISVFVLISNLFAQTKNISTDLVNVLSEKGFENIRVADLGDELVLAYENRLYRFNVDAIKDVLETVTPIISQKLLINLISQNRKIPVVSTKVKVKDCYNYFSGQITDTEFADKLEINFDVDEEWEKVKNKPEYNSSGGRFDLAFKPTISAQFGVYTDPVMWQLNIVPSVKTTLWKGMLFNYELIVPIHNDLLPLEDSVRTGLAVINQTLRLPNSWFVSTSVGYFSNNRYGFDFETKKYFANGDINFGINFGLTAFAYFVGKRFNYSDQFLWTGAANFDFKIPKYNLTLGFSAGKFLMEDYTFRFDVNREFGEIEIGLFALRSANGISNGGINIIIPLFPSKYWKPDFIRIRTEENFGFSYLVRSNSADLIGLRYNTGNRINSFIKKLNPEFIRNNFIIK